MLRILAPGDVFGLVTLLPRPMYYMVNVDAISDCNLLVWEHARLRKFARAFPQLAENALHISLRYLKGYTNRHARHSAATRAEVRIGACDGTLKMTIKDDGTGFDPAVAARGLGLATMRERLRLIGGDLVVSSKLGKGTEVTAQAKLNPPLSQTAAA